MSALEEQVGGTHYMRSHYQLIRFIFICQLNFIQGNIAKYCFRYRYKNGKEDLEKAAHYCRIAQEYHFERKWDWAKDILHFEEFIKANNLQDDMFFKVIMFNICIGDYKHAEEKIRIKIDLDYK